MVTSTDEQFRERMHELVDNEAKIARAQMLVRQYWYEQPYRGRYFDRFRDSERPNEITEKDLVAVSMLSVTVPPPVEIWLLSDEGRGQITDLLSCVPVDAELSSDGHLLDPDGDLYSLWKLLQQGSWPDPNPANGMATTKISKLIATKRPMLVPIYDSVIRNLLGRVDNYWDAYRHALDEEGLTLWRAATKVGPDDVPLLRKIDALLWMIGTTEASHR